MATSSTKYLRTTVRTELSRSSDYADPLSDTSFTSAEEVTLHSVNIEFLAATGAGTTIALDQFTTIHQVMIWNRDPTNYVDVTFRTGAGGATDQTLRVYDGTPLMLGYGVTGSGGTSNDIDFAADTAACECVMHVFGA